MSATEFVLRHPGMLALGWALVHFLWQGAIVGVVAAGLLRAARPASASTRYAIATIAMAVMLVVAAGTWRYLAGRQGPIAPAPASQITASDVVVANGVLTGRQVTASRSALPDSFDRGTGGSIQPARAPLAMSVLLFVYAVGVLVLSLRLAGGWYFARRLTRRLVKPAAADLVALADRVAERLALHRAVRLLESSLVGAPAVVGWIAPVVLLPVAALAGLSSAQLEALIAHELAHVKRHDYLVNLLQSAVETLLFYHPAVWWVSRQVRIEREHCCDDVAVALCGDRIVYASALAELETMRTPALALAATDGSLVSRVRRILAAPAQPRSTAPGWMGVLLVLLMVSVVPAIVGSVRADKSKTDDQATTKASKPAGSSQTGKPATPADQKPVVYHIRATDTLHIVVSGEPTLSRNYAVQSDGVIVFPLMRPLKVVGLTTDALAAAIAKALALPGNGPDLIDPAVMNTQLTQSMNALDDAKAAVTSAQQKYDRLKAYQIDDPKTDVQKSGALTDPDIKDDANVRGFLTSIKSIENSLRQQKDVLGHGPSHPEVVTLTTRQAEDWSSLRQEIEGIVETAKKTLDNLRNEEIAKGKRYESVKAIVRDMRLALSKVPKVTVTVVKPGAAPVETSEAQMVLASQPSSAKFSHVYTFAPESAPSAQASNMRDVTTSHAGPAKSPETQTVSPLPSVTPSAQTPPGPLKEYVVGPRDVLRIQVSEVPLFPPRQYQVGNDGAIFFFDSENLRSVHVGGLTTKEIQEAIRVGLVKDAILTNAAVTVIVEMFHSKTVFVSGEVRRSGQIQLTADRHTLQQVLDTAGGATFRAGPEVIVLRHKDATVTGMIDPQTAGSDIERTSYYLLYLTHGRLPDPELRDGDTVYVPFVKGVTLLGEVFTPGRVVWLDGMTVLQAITAAGGPTARAATNRMKIARLNPTTHTYDQIDATLTTVLEPDDILTVPKKF